ncbi:MAG: TetR/AcrR family transcriptional regulator [Fimbriimonadaceae bacterium]|nr:TetR/AcrR family transcriptional regulator [Fimbriimonadaceae bacterium]
MSDANNSFHKGRPRNSTMDDAIMSTAIDHLGKYGYRGLSMTRLASEAGVTKPALYRRFKSKEEIAKAALIQLETIEEVRLTGNWEQDLMNLMSASQRALQQPNGTAIFGMLLNEEWDSPELLELFRDEITSTQRKQFRDVLDQARAAGYLRDDVKLNVVINMMIGGLYAKYTADGRLPKDWYERVTNHALMILRK